MTTTDTPASSASNRPDDFAAREVDLAGSEIAQGVRGGQVLESVNPSALEKLFPTHWGARHA